jgi:hypothetical protein
VHLLRCSALIQQQSSLCCPRHDGRLRALGKCTVPASACVRLECEIAGGPSGGKNVPALQFRCFGLRSLIVTEIAPHHSQNQLGHAGCDFAGLFPLFGIPSTSGIPENGTFAHFFGRTKKWARCVNGLIYIGQVCIGIVNSAACSLCGGNVQIVLAIGNAEEYIGYAK